jgi:8-oxo-dGTP pyrophosphatase MutT (NUDIX family)
MKQEDLDRMTAFFETNHYDQEPDDPMSSEAAAHDPDDMPAAAGVMYIASDDFSVLLCKRTDPNAYWAFPAGTIEEGEAPIECATREFFEEMQHECPDLSEAHSVTITNDDGVVFTCYTVSGPKFTPKLDREHSAFAWVSPKFMPAPVHPGVVQCLLAVATEDL